MNRGDEREDFFDDEEDLELFLETLCHRPPSNQRRESQALPRREVDPFGMGTK